MDGHTDLVDQLFSESFNDQKPIIQDFVRTVNPQQQFVQVHGMHDTALHYKNMLEAKTQEMDAYVRKTQNYIMAQETQIRQLQKQLHETRAFLSPPIQPSNQTSINSPSLTPISPYMVSPANSPMPSNITPESMHVNLQVSNDISLLPFASLMPVQPSQPTSAMPQGFTHSVPNMRVSTTPNPIPSVSSATATRLRRASFNRRSLSTSSLSTFTKPVSSPYLTPATSIPLMSQSFTTESIYSPKVITPSASSSSSLTPSSATFQTQQPNYPTATSPSPSSNSNPGNNNNNNTNTNNTNNNSNSATSNYNKWSPAEDALLHDAVALHGVHGKWSLIASMIPNRTAIQCSARWTGALNPRIHKGKWSPDEDRALLSAYEIERARVERERQMNMNHNIHNNNHNNLTLSTIVMDSDLNWQWISSRIPGRTGVQCIARYQEALDPTVKKGKWSREEDILLRKGMELHGRCWVKVAEGIVGRTQRQCRTRWLQLKEKWGDVAAGDSSNTGTYGIDAGVVDALDEFLF
ncbi:hypothetical protein HDU76_000344 [Blyttiomyces sp. JEL0837]|nr:hypothetical protein HDU76_000344 [Blyttiomyces sp. JEL0837]